MSTLYGNISYLHSTIVVHLDTGDIDVKVLSSVDSALASPKATVVEPTDGDNGMIMYEGHFRFNNY